MFEKMVEEARSLLDEKGFNPEYLRGMCELIARCFPTALQHPTNGLATHVERLLLKQSSISRIREQATYTE
jgi:hypothetical protein